MRNLLVPTDFSHCAGEALKVALSLARRFEARLFLFHYLGPSPVEQIEGEEEALLRRARAQLEAIAGQHPDVRIEAVAVNGRSLREEIESYVRRHGIGLVVMGSHGVSGKSEYFIGSNTQKVVRTLRCPVLVVKEAPRELTFDRVVFASSFNEKEREAFLRFKEFVRPFLPEIHLIAVQTSSLFEPPYTVTREAMEDFRGLGHPFPCKIHIFKDFSVERGIRAFADEIGAKLIGISNHHRHPIRRMLVGSNVEALINHADAPVLTIDYEEDEAEKE